MGRPAAAAACLAVVTLAASCATNRPPAVPATVTPGHWSAAALAAPAEGGVSATEERADLARIWSGFGDARLTDLISRGLAASPELRLAVLRLDEARAQRDVAAAGLAPAVNAGASATRQRLSTETPTGALFSTLGNVRLPGVGAVSIPNPYNQYELSGSASWEPDLFGRVRGAIAAADARALASTEDLRGVRIALVANIAEAWFRLRGAVEGRRISASNVATLAELLDLTRQRRTAGLATDLDVDAAMAELATARARAANVELAITQGVNQVAALIGREPGALREELLADAARSLAAVPDRVPIGVPADLARQRPDIRAAEATLAATSADLGTARAQLFPRLVFSVNGGVQSQSASTLAEWAARFGVLGAALSVPVFDRGVWKSVKVYEVRGREAAVSYERVVLAALHDVENTVAALRAAAGASQALAAGVDAGTDAVALTRQRYTSGLAPFLEVLQVQRTLQESEQTLTDARTDTAVALVHLYRALGGGWDTR